MMSIYKCIFGLIFVLSEETTGEQKHYHGPHDTISTNNRHCSSFDT